MAFSNRANPLKIIQDWAFNGRSQEPINIIIFIRPKLLPGEVQRISLTCE